MNFTLKFVVKWTSVCTKMEMLIFNTDPLYLVQIENSSLLLTIMSSDCSYCTDSFIFWWISIFCWFRKTCTFKDILFRSFEKVWLQAYNFFLKFIEYSNVWFTCLHENWYNYYLANYNECTVCSTRQAFLCSISLTIFLLFLLVLF